MDRVLQALADQWLYDIETISQHWMLWTVIPASLYFAVMLVKWLIMLLPVWLPAVIIIGAWRTR